MTIKQLQKGQQIQQALKELPKLEERPDKDEVSIDRFDAYKILTLLYPNSEMCQTINNSYRILFYGNDAKEIKKLIDTKKVTLEKAFKSL